MAELDELIAQVAPLLEAQLDALAAWAGLLPARAIADASPSAPVTSAWPARSDEPARSDDDRQRSDEPRAASPREVHAAAARDPGAATVRDARAAVHGAREPERESAPPSSVAFSGRLPRLRSDGARAVASPTARPTPRDAPPAATSPTAPAGAPVSDAPPFASTAVTATRAAAAATAPAPATDRSDDAIAPVERAARRWPATNAPSPVSWPVRSSAAAPPLHSDGDTGGSDGDEFAWPPAWAARTARDERGAAEAPRARLDAAALPRVDDPWPADAPPALAAAVDAEEDPAALEERVADVLERAAREAGIDLT
jgi:hypothetical protein